MIGFLPELYSDELVYSWFARYYLHSGYVTYIDVADELFNNKRVRPIPEFINVLNAETKRIITQKISVEKLIENHTMFPAYGRFIPMERRKTAFESFLQLDCKWNLLYAPTSNRKNKYLRWCPDCVKEDRNKCGESYWHRIHQIAGLNICPIHHCKLVESSVYTGKAAPNLITAESEVKEDVEVDYHASLKEIKLAEYMQKIFYTPINFDVDYNAGKYLSNQINTEMYVYKDSIARKMDILYQDYLDFFAEVDTDLMSMNAIQKIYNGGIAPLHYIAQLALFENVDIGKLLNASNMDRDIRKDIFKKVSIQIGESEELVSRIGTVVLDEYTKSYRAEKKSKRSIAKWSHMDEQLLPDVKNTVASIYGDGNERPHRVTVKAVCTKMNLPDKRFDNLPLCKKEIDKWKETQEHYWAREVLWTLEYLQEQGESINWNHVRRITNMRKANLESALIDIKELTDTETYDCIRQFL